MAVQNYFEGMPPLGAGIGNALSQIAVLKQRDRALAADEQSNALMQQRFSAGQDEATRLREQEQTKMLAGAIYEDVKRGNPRGIAAAQAILDRIEPGLGQQMQDPASLAAALGRMYGFTDQEQGGIKIGQYNPGDYTPQSWSQFLQSKDPSVLARQYAPPSPPNQTVIQLPQGQAAFNPRTGQTTLLSERGDQRAAEAADAAATVSAQEGVKADVEAKKAKVTGEKTYAAFDSAMSAHEGALAGTETGPLAGRVPAVTSAQQKAVASKAALAPILKQIFRSAGEGIFTDKDQQLLLEMMPDRTLTPEAREFASQNVRNIVKAKLGIQADAPIKIETDDQYDMLPSGVQFVGPDGVTRRKP